MITLHQVEALTSKFAGTPVTLSCDAPSSFPAGEAGWVWFNADGSVVATIHIPAASCRRLETAQTSPSIIPQDFLILAHEAEHIALDNQNECQVEAAAVANEWSLVRLFKLAAWRVQAILAGADASDRAMGPAYHEGC